MKSVEIFQLSTADPSLASSYWLQPDLEAPGWCLFSDDFILIVLRFLTDGAAMRQYKFLFLWCSRYEYQ